MRAIILQKRIIIFQNERLETSREPSINVIVYHSSYFWNFVDDCKYCAFLFYRTRVWR